MPSKPQIRRGGKIRQIPYSVTYRNIKYPRLEFRTGELVLILPHNGHDPDEIIEKHRKWIEGKIKFITDHLKRSSKVKIKKRSYEEFKSLVKEFVEEHTKILNVKVNRIYIRRMKTKWASCSRKRNITANLLLRHLPDYLIRYVLYHEMAHIIELTHNDRFWRIIEKQYPDHNKYESELFVYWFRLYKNANNFIR